MNSKIEAHEALKLRNISIELSTLPVEKILSKIAEVACSVFSARSSIVTLLESRVDESIRGAKFPVEDDRPFRPRDHGLTYEVTNICKPLIIPNVQEDARVKAATKERGIQSILGAPLMASRRQNDVNEVRAIGALFVELEESREFDDHAQELLQSLANQAAIAIENDRHTRALRQLNLASLEIISAKRTIPSLAETILAKAVKLVNAKGGRLCLLNEENTAVEWGIMTNDPGQPKKITMDANVGVFGHVIKTRRPYAVSNYQNWPQRVKEFDKYRFTAVAGIPIINQQYIWGAILIHDDESGRIFDQDALDLLTNLANLAAVALSNVSRVDDLERLIESAFAAVIAVDNQGRITQFNQQAEQMLQYSRKDVIGRSIIDFYYYEADPRRIQKLMLESGTDGKIKEFFTHLKSKKGQKIPIKLSASLLFDYDGRRSGSVGFFQDQRDEAGMAIASLLDQDEIFESIVSQAWNITGASHSAHLALNIDGKLQVTVARPPETKEQKERFPIDFASPKRIGISGRAFRTGQSQLIGNVKADPDYIDFDSNTHSELSVPIKTQNEVIGVIDVQYPDLDAFSDTDQKNLEALARYAAIAIHNAQLYNESQIDKRRFEAIADIIRGAAQSLEINDILRSTCRQLEDRIFQEKNAVISIRLFDKDTNVLRFEPEWHESFHDKIDHKAGKDFTTQSLDEGICGRVARERRSRNVGDVKTSSKFFRLISSTVSEMAVPIHLDETNELIGVLDAQSPELNAFTQNDLEFLEILARQLAVDIDKAKLTEDAQRSLGEREARRRAREAVTRSSELRETVDEIIFQVWQIAKEQSKCVNSVVLRQVRNSKSILVAAYPPDIEKQLTENLRVIDIEKGIDGRIGISGRAIQLGKTQLVNDVSKNEDYRMLHDTTQSELTIPIRFNDEVIAVMDIESAEKDAFRAEDQQIFEDLAAEAGMAVHGSYQYDALVRRSKHQEAVHKASSLISNGIKSSQRDLLYHIVEQAVEGIIPASGRKATIGVIQLYDADKHELRRESIYPQSAITNWEQKLGSTRPLERTIDNQIGVHGRAVLEHRSQLVNDVSTDLDYVEVNPTTRSELAVLLLDDKEEILGVLGLESDELNAFDEEDRQALLNLAYLAVIAIQNAEQYQALEETRGALVARSTVAWLAAERASWRHNIVGHIATLENYIKLLEIELESGAPQEAFLEHFSNMRRVIDKTREHKIAEPLSPIEGKKRVLLDEFLKQWLEKVYWDPALRGEGELCSQLDSGDAYIEVNPGWFQLALDNIVKNSLNAMENSKVRKLTLQTSIVDDMAEIVFSDTGPGIPDEIRCKMFKEPIPKAKGEHGEGIGQLLTGTIIETYGGKIDIPKTDKNGTSVRVKLPLNREASRLPSTKVIQPV